MSTSPFSPSMDSSLLEASANTPEESPPALPEPIVYSPNAIEPSQREPASEGWCEKIPQHWIETGCEVCFTISNLNGQLQDLRVHYQGLCAAYNQARRDSDLQAQQTECLGSMLDTERIVRMETETRYQALQGTLAAVEERHKEAEREHMTTITKLTDILFNWQVVGENVVPRQG